MPAPRGSLSVTNLLEQKPVSSRRFYFASPRFYFCHVVCPKNERSSSTLHITVLVVQLPAVRLPGEALSNLRCSAAQAHTGWLWKESKHLQVPPRQSPLLSSDSSQFLSTCSSSPLVFGCSKFIRCSFPCSTVYQKFGSLEQDY